MRAMTHKMTLLLKWKMTRPSRFLEMKQMYYWIAKSIYYCFFELLNPIHVVSGDLFLDIAQ